MPVLADELAAARGELARIDSKCAALTALAGAAAAYTAGQVGHNPLPVRVSMALAGIAFSAAVLVLLACVLRPRTGSGGIYRWALMTTAEITSRARQLAPPGGHAPTTEAARAAQDEAAGLLQALAVIAVTKYQRLRLAVDLAAAGVILLAAAAVISAGTGS